MELKLQGKHDVYIEVARRYKEYIELGVIKNGEKLPSVRCAAGDLGVNPNTVAKAYALLETDGYICSLPKKGAFVIYEKKNGEQREYLKELETLKQFKAHGIDKQTLINLIEEVYKDD